MRIEAFALTDVGVQRDHNEDAFDIISSADFFVVADGMGGHASGQVASRLAIENLRKYVTVLAKQSGHEFTFPVHEGDGPPEQLVSNAIQWANERIFIESLKERQYEGMGTTIVVAMAYGDVVVLGHVGDSRIYRFRDGELVQLTRDHSLLNHYIQQGRIKTEEEAKNFKERNIIVKALGLKDYVEPSVEVADRQPGDVFLLCTDGLTDQVDDWIIANVMEGNGDDLPMACEAMIRLANDAGGKDNCTVMLLKMGDAPERAEKTAPAEAIDPEDSTEPNLPAMPDPAEEAPAVEPAETPPPVPEAAKRRRPPLMETVPDTAAVLPRRSHVTLTETMPDSAPAKRKRRSTLIDTYEPPKKSGSDMDDET